MKINKKVLGLVIASTMVLGGCSSNTPNEKEESQVTQPKVEQKVEEEKAPEQNTKLSLASGAAFLETFVEDKFEYSEVEYDEENRTIVLKITGADMATSYIMSDDETINYFEETMAESNLVIKQSLETIIGEDDFMFITAVLNDRDKDKVLLMIADGVITYSYRTKN